jgi:hypothetical protein
VNTSSTVLQLAHYTLTLRNVMTPMPYTNTEQLSRLAAKKKSQQPAKNTVPEVFGVISASPAYGMNSGAGTDETHPYVALSGRVPVRVVGKVRKGDRLVTSGVAGHAMSAGIREGRCLLAVCDWTRPRRQE